MGTTLETVEFVGLLRVRDPEIFQMLDAVLRTVFVAAAAVFLTLLVATPLAYRVSRWKSRGRRFVDALLSVPMVLPPTVVGFALLWSLGRRGFAGKIIYQLTGSSLVFTVWAAIIAASVVSFPILYRSARTAFDKVNPRLEDVARTLGVSEAELFWRVSFPLARRGIVAGAVLGTARAMGEFGATLMVAGNIPGLTQTLPLAIYEAVQGGRDVEALGLSALIAAVGMAMLLLVDQLETVETH